MIYLLVSLPTQKNNLQTKRGPFWKCFGITRHWCGGWFWNLQFADHRGFDDFSCTCSPLSLGTCTFCTWLLLLCLVHCSTLLGLVGSCYSNLETRTNVSEKRGRNGRGCNFWWSGMKFLFFLWWSFCLFFLVCHVGVVGMCGWNRFKDV